MEQFKKTINTFFLLFTCVMFSAVIYLTLIGGTHFSIADIKGMFVMSALFSLTELVFYAKDELSRRQTLIRYAIHLPICVAISLGTATYLRWLSWSNPFQIFTFTSAVLCTYLLVIALDYYQSNKLADELTQKLNERYKDI